MFGENSGVIQNENYDYLEYGIVCIWKGNVCGTRRKAYDQKRFCCLKKVAPNISAHEKLNT